MRTRLLSDYEYYLKIERAMSPNTVASYCSDVKKFAEFHNDALEKADPDAVISYLSSRKKLSERSQARLLSSLRSFYDWLILEKIIEENPCDKVDMPKLGVYLPTVLSVEEVEAIIDSVQREDWFGLRDKAILEVLYGCGLRVSEAVELKISGVYLDEGFLRVIGKGNKERLVPLGEMAGDALDRKSVV